MDTTNVGQIRKSNGHPVTTFKKLLDEVALVTINHRNFDMFLEVKPMTTKTKMEKVNSAHQFIGHWQAKESLEKD